MERGTVENKHQMLNEREWSKIADCELAALRRWIDDGGNIDVRGSGAKTLLHDAIQANRWQRARYLLSNGARADLRDEFGCTPFLDACRCGHLWAVLDLARIDAIDPFVHDYSGNTALHSIATVCKPVAPKLIRLLVGFGVPIDAFEFDLGLTPLQAAIQFGAYSNAMQLIKAGARVDISAKDGRTPIEIAQSELAKRWFLIVSDGWGVPFEGSIAKQRIHRLVSKLKMIKR